MDELRRDYEIFTAVWKVYKDLYPAQSLHNDEYWKRVTESIGQVYQNHQEPLCMELLKAIAAELERRAKVDEDKDAGRNAHS